MRADAGGQRVAPMLALLVDAQVEGHLDAYKVGAALHQILGELSGTKEHILFPLHLDEAIGVRTHKFPDAAEAAAAVSWIPVAPTAFCKLST